MPTTPIINKPIDALQELKSAISQESCIKKEPFIKLEEAGEASILNYNLPQATCYDATGMINLNVDRRFFKSSELEVPANSFWTTYAEKTLEEVRVDLDTKVNAIPRQSLIVDAGHLNASSVAYNNPSSASMLKTAQRLTENIELNVEDKPLVRPYSLRVDKDYLSVRIKQGYMPVPYVRFSGIKDIRYVPKPITPNPQLTLVLHFKVCSYLGDYGAGQTIKTFSLLPGEKMEIGIRHYLRNEITKKQTEHVLDSFSTSAAEDLQNTVEHENTFSHTDSETETKEKNWNIGGNLGVSVGVFNLGVQGGGGGTKGHSLNSATQNMVRDLDSAITKHVAKADTLRQIDVNTESTTSSISEDEETIKRYLENYNKSRVLNFVFRQLLQEYFTITYLDSVTFSYTNGYPDHTKSCDLAGLEKMLSEILIDDATVQSEANKIYSYLCNVVDYQGTKQQFIELVNEDNGNCINTTAAHVINSYVRKKAGLSQTYNGKTINGVILSTVHRIIRTSSLVADALLGQGEALDCYNQKLQDAASINAHLTNLELVQKIASIEQITDPVTRADEYKKIFGSCCTTPQTQVIS